MEETRYQMRGEITLEVIPAVSESEERNTSPDLNSVINTVTETGERILRTALRA